MRRLDGIVTAYSADVALSSRSRQIFALTLDTIRPEAPHV